MRPRRPNKPTQSSRVTVVIKTNQGGLWILPQLRELVRRGHAVTVVLPAGQGHLRRGLELEPVRVREISFQFSFRPSLALLRGLVEVRRAILDTRPDVVFYHLYASALASRLATIGSRIARVHMVAGPLYLDSPLIRLAERGLMRLDHCVIAGSEHTARRYRDLGLRAERIVTIPYGVDVRRFSRQQDRRSELFGVPRDTFVVAMVAYVYAPKVSVHRGLGIKGHDTLLAAWTIFHKCYPDSLLVLVGGGFNDSGEVERQRLITRFSLDTDPSVVWMDTVSDVRAVYSSADVSVSPSLSENHGAALEAASMGLPCIVSDAGGLPETVTSKTGWVVPAADTLGYVHSLRQALELKRSDLLCVMGSDARALMEAQFTVAASARRIADELEKTLGVHSSPQTKASSADITAKGPPDIGKPVD